VLRLVQEAEIAQRDRQAGGTRRRRLPEFDDRRAIQFRRLGKPVKTFQRCCKIRQRHAVSFGLRTLPIEAGERPMQQFRGVPCIVLVEQYQREVAFPRHDIGVVRPERGQIDRQRLPQQLLGTIERSGEL
jgi:hypothetical protein